MASPLRKVGQMGESGPAAVCWLWWASCHSPLLFAGQLQQQPQGQLCTSRPTLECSADRRVQRLSCPAFKDAPRYNFCLAHRHSCLHHRLMPRHSRMRLAWSAWCISIAACNVSSSRSTQGSFSLRIAWRIRSAACNVVSCRSTQDCLVHQFCCLQAVSCRSNQRRSRLEGLAHQLSCQQHRSSRQLPQHFQMLLACTAWRIASAACNIFGWPQHLWQMPLAGIAWRIAFFTCHAVRGHSRPPVYG